MAMQMSSAAFARTKSSVPTRMSKSAKPKRTTVGYVTRVWNVRRFGRCTVVVANASSNASSRVTGTENTYDSFGSGEALNSHRLLRRTAGSDKNTSSYFGQIHSHSPNVTYVLGAKPPGAATVAPSPPFQLATYWPLIVIFQTAALVGAAVSGISSRKKRLELKSLNDKLRLMMANDDDTQNCAFDWDNLEGQCTAAWPGAVALAEGTEFLMEGNIEKALEAFQVARHAVETKWSENKTSEDSKNETSETFAVDKLSGVAAASYLAATKGYAACLCEKGSAKELRTAVSVLKTVEILGKRSKDASLFGAIADALADLG
jgi:hypothetical protein